MKTIEDFIQEKGYANWYAHTSETEGEVVINYGDSKQIALEYAREAIKTDRQNLLKHAKIGKEWYQANEMPDGMWFDSVDKNSIINAPQIELL